MSFPNQPQPPSQFPPGQFPQNPNIYSPAPIQQVPPPKKSSRSTWLIVVIIFAVVMLGFCVLAAGAFMWVRSLAKDSTETKTVKSFSQRASLKIPKNWSSSLSLNSIADIQVGNNFSEKYIIVIEEPKSDFQRGASANTYADLVYRNMKMGTPSFSRSNYKKVTVDGKPAVQFRLVGYVEGLHLVYWVTAVEGSNHFYQITAWTSKKRETENQESLLKVVNSFKGK